MNSLLTMSGKYLFVLAQPLLIIYFRLHTTPRVRIILTDNDDNILLVKGWFSLQRWELPGGGIEKDETPVQAVKRELLEETGVNIKDDSFDDLGIVTHTAGSLNYKVQLFSCRIDSFDDLNLGSKRWWEIISVRYFPARKLPDDTSRLVHRSLMRARELNG